MTTKPKSSPITHDYSYASLPEVFYSLTAPMSVVNPSMALFNDAFAQELNLPKDWGTQQDTLEFLAGNTMPEGAQPLSMAYSGHQFGGWSAILGDGRAQLIGEIDTPNGLLDLQLKGSGPTPYARRGDGRATLGSVIREFLISEAMAGLGIATTRSLAVIATGETVSRGAALPGGILARTAQSHVRVGTFQFAAAHVGPDGVRALADYMIARNFPEIDAASPDKYRDLLREAISRQARLVAKWVNVGFIHGVMNTDNMAITGETIDYGPCAFMDAFHPQKVFSSIDHHGRYAWDKQAPIALWNLTRLAESFLYILPGGNDEAVSTAQQELDRFSAQFKAAYHEGMAQKLALPNHDKASKNFIAGTLDVMAACNVDFTLFFRHLTQIADGHDDSEFLSLFSEAQMGKDWLIGWHRAAHITKTSIEKMRLANPIYIARNHRVEEAIRAAEDNSDYGPFMRLANILTAPFTPQDGQEGMEAPPLEHECVRQTFCGT